MTDADRHVVVGLVGLDGSGVRTLLGGLCGALEPVESGTRTWEGVEITFRSARPGSVDLVDVDLLVVVLSARQGVPPDLAAVWELAAECALPSIIAVTHLDDSRADLEEIAAMCQRVLGDGGEIFLPWLPIHDDDERVCGFINLLSEEIIDWSDGGPVVHASEERHQELIEDTRAELCESVLLAVDDDQLFAEYMSGTPIDGETIEAHMLEQISRGLRHPVMGTATEPHLLGIGLVLDIIAGVSRQRHV